ncbi:hypothetical protein [Luteibacter mycovicinus]|nr:hypothetical protein [Luteibacter sp. 9143a]
MIRREAPVIPSANRGSKYLNAKKALPTKRSQVAANIDFLRFSAGAGYVFGSETEGDAMIWSAERFVRTLAPKSGIHVEPA